MTGQKQVFDMRAGKRMTVAQSNEHLRVGADTAKTAKIAGTYDGTRTHLNFEIGKGGVVKEVDRRTSIARRIKAILDSHGISDPNAGLSDDELKKPKVGVRTHCNIILEGSRETMRQLAFGEQTVDYEQGHDNTHVTRSHDIEKWAQDMYAFVVRKYGEENIAAFVVHLDESLPHIHCTLVPITKSGKLSYREIFAGENKYELAKRTKQLHDELAEVNKKWGLERGKSIAVTGAQHKSYLQWLKEQIVSNKETIMEQGETINRQETVIAGQKKQLYAINDEIRKAEKKLKAFTTMLANLKEQKVALEIDITALEDMRETGNEEATRELEKKQKKLEEIIKKISYREQQLADVQQQLHDLSVQKYDLQKEFDSQKRQLNRQLPNLLDKTQSEVNDTFWELAAQEMKKDYTAFQEFSKGLTADQRNDFENLLEGSFFEDMAQRGEQMAACAAALFLGYLDAATKIAQSGGGGGNTGGWGRRKDEDDETYRRRCCIMGRMMMKPTGRKLKRA